DHHRPDHRAARPRRQPRPRRRLPRPVAGRPGGDVVVQHRVLPRRRQRLPRRLVRQRRELLRRGRHHRHGDRGLHRHGRGGPPAGLPAADHRAARRPELRDRRRVHVPAVPGPARAVAAQSPRCRAM
ncbi:MAG: hypothetical protein AVDCRST_MAG54-3175, partial [uncultured Actinomycetospora sp.]